MHMYSICIRRRHTCLLPPASNQTWPCPCQPDYNSSVLSINPPASHAYQDAAQQGLVPSMTKTIHGARQTYALAPWPLSPICSQLMITPHSLTHPNRQNQLPLSTPAASIVWSPSPHGPSGGTGASDGWTRPRGPPSSFCSGPEKSWQS